MTGADQKEFPMQRTFTTVSELGKGRYQERYQVIQGRDTQDAEDAEREERDAVGGRVGGGGCNV
jgi:hypothetical protein